jgi:hypothetical protein
VAKEEPAVVQVKEEPVEKPVPEKKDEVVMKNVPIPDELRGALVDDWYLIQKQDKLYNLPAKPNVRDVLDEYIKYKISKKENDKSSESCLREVAKGDEFQIFLYFILTQFLHLFRCLCIFRHATWKATFVQVREATVRRNASETPIKNYVPNIWPTSSAEVVCLEGGYGSALSVR